MESAKPILEGSPLLRSYIHKSWRTSTLAAVAIFFFCAVSAFFLARREMGLTPEFTLGHAILTAREWLRDGILSHRFIGHFPAGEMGLTQGRVYLSYPLGTFLLPWMISQLVGAPVSALQMQMVGFAFHLGTAGLLWSLLTRRASSSLPGLIAASLYLLSPAAIWFHSQVVYGDTLVHFFWIAWAILYLKTQEAIETQRSLRLSHWVLASFVLWAGTWTEYLFWFAAALSGAKAIYSAWKANGQERKRYFKFAVFIAAIAGTALLVNCAVYIWGAGGLAEFKAILAERLQSRGAAVSKAFLFHQINQFLRPALPYWILLLSALGAFAYMLLNETRVDAYRRLKQSLKDHKDFLLTLLLILVIPAIIHTSRFNDLVINHPFTILKFVLIFCCILGGALGFMLSTPGGRRAQPTELTRSVFLAVIAIASLFAGARLFKHHYAAPNRLGELSRYYGVLASKHVKNGNVAIWSRSFVQQKLKEDADYFLLPMYYYFSDADSRFTNHELLLNDLTKDDKSSRRVYFLSKEEYLQHHSQLKVLEIVDQELYVSEPL